MRATAYTHLIEGLQQRCAAVVIMSLGGMGKTSLAQEVAARCYRASHHIATEQAPLFDAVIWVSDKDTPGATTLALVLDEIARVLEQPGLTQLPVDQRRFAVEQLLRRHRSLLVIDNVETIGDTDLVRWLLRLPSPARPY